MKKFMIYTGVIACFLGIMFAAKEGREYREEGQVTEAEKSSKVCHWAKPKEEYLEYYELGDFETKLPVLYINTQGKTVEKDNKIWAYLAVYEAPIEGEKRRIMREPDYEAAITINHRGASSYLQFDKKQYRIKFYQEEGSSKAKEYEFLGMGAGSEWVLNGPFLDRTLLRNRLVYGLGKEVSVWAPDCCYIELFLNGEYQGVYLAVEPVTSQESRLGLSDFGLLSGETAYIVKRDRVDTEQGALNVYGTYTAKTLNALYIDYPTKTKLTARQREWITEDISRFETILYGDSFADPGKGYMAYLKTEEFVDYYILNEVVMNNDAGNLSTYVYKELGGKLQIAIWDYNNCYDNYQWFSQDYREFFLQDNAWFSRLLQDRAFVERVVERYEELRQGILKEESIYQRIDDYAEELGEAVKRNFAIWGYTFRDSFLADQNEFHKDPADYEEAIALLKKSIHARFVFLDEHITDLYQGCVN